MTIGRRRGAAAALLAVAVVGLSSCSDDPEPTFAPPSSSPSASEPPAEPVKEAWEKKTKAGAVAFAKHWVDVFNEAQETGDTSGIRALSTDSCKSCAGFAAQLEELYGDGGRLESDGWSVRQVTPIEGLPDARPRVALRIDRSTQVIHHADRPKERYRGGLASFSAQLLWSDDQWRLDELVLVQ